MVGIDLPTSSTGDTIAAYDNAASIVLRTASGETALVEEDAGQTTGATITRLIPKVFAEQLTLPGVDG